MIIFYAAGQGEVVDESDFFGLYDVLHSGSSGPDGALDLREFGWYVADCAESQCWSHSA